MNEETHVISWSNKLLDYLLAYRQQHPDFKFWLRQRDRGDRLSNGYWFQGNDNYIFLSFWARSGGTNMTRSLGWVLGIDEDGTTRTSMEVAYNGEKDQEIIAMYNTVIKRFNMEPVTDTKYKTRFEETDPFKSLEQYLTVIKPAIDDIIRKAGKEEMFIDEQDFNEMLTKTLTLRQAGPKSQQSPLNILMVNITWNSQDWQSPSDDKSNHGWVKEGNTPFESWNFDFTNERNPADKIFGYCQFVAAPLVEGTNNIIIFYSQGKIVGFYGKAEVLREPVMLPNEMRYNLIGEKALSLVLANKLDNIKESGYLEGKQRMGQNGFIYLSKPETVLAMLEEAAALNPAQEEKLTNLKNWIEGFAELVQTKDNIHSMDTALNQIFFGPPGTGKTYHTVSEAIKIVDPEFYKTNQGNRTKLKERFRKLLINWQIPNPEGQITFCTFHQSFSYEDFVEGIKPVKPEERDTYLKYKVEDGIFKRICRLSEDDKKTNQLKTSRLISWNEETFKKAVFYKVSLGDANNAEDQTIYEYCITNKCIALGYGGPNDYTGLDEEQIVRKCRENKEEGFAEKAVNRFIHYLKVGNYVMISNGNHYIRAIGKVTGAYEYKPNTSIRYSHFRAVEWLVVNENIPIGNLYDRVLSQQTIYKMDEDGIKKDFFVNVGQLVKETSKSEKNFVLIIDEINRGNVSSIFGELITLIEKDKRDGGVEELEVTLPYSKEPFKVPDNVYIIGTMNTADRSIEALDTALRRRFAFLEMQSKPELLITESKSKGKIGSIDLVKLLNTINQRIEKLIDKDHKIGHAYFMEDTTEEALKNTFHNKVIPLLQEYFFGDFGKIGLVLGNSFVEKVNDGFEFAKFESYDSSVSTDLKERPVYRIADRTKWNFQSIYE